MRSEFSIQHAAPLIIWVWLCSLIVGACSYSPNPAPPAANLPTATPTPTSERGSGGTLRLAYWGAPTILNPHLSAALKDWEASRITYEPLASYDQKGTLVPFLAAEIPSLENGGLAEDFTSVTWKLKPGVRWSDGEPFTADDVLFTYEFVKTVDSYSFIAYKNIENMEVLDDHTIRIAFKTPDPEWMLPFTGNLGMILPRHKFADYVGEQARDAPANWGDQDGDTVGTGPYRVVSFQSQRVLLLGDRVVKTNKIEYEPNDYFRKADQPYFSKVELHGGGAPTTAAEKVLEEGSAHYAYSVYVPEEELDTMQQAGKGELRMTFGSRVHMIQINHSNPERGSQQHYPHPLFNDKRVRQAFAHAIDREHIASTVYGPMGNATTNYLVAPPAYQSPNQYYPFDLDRAAQLLDEAGWVDTDGDGIRDKEGQPMHVTYQSYISAFIQPMQKIIQEDLASIGVRVDLELSDISKFLGDPSNSESYYRFLADMQSTDMVMDNRVPGLHFALWTCDQIPTAQNNWAFLNTMRWCNPEYDALEARATTEPDTEQRRDLFIALNDMLVEDVAIIPVVHVARVSAVSTTLQGVEFTPWDSDTWKIKDWRDVGSS